MMKFQVFLIFSFCYSAVKGGPGGFMTHPFTLGALVDKRFGVRVCQCYSGSSPAKIMRPIPLPYVVGMRKGMPSLVLTGANGLGYYGVDAMRCSGSCPPPRLAKLHVHRSLSSGTSNAPDDTRLTIYTSDNSKICVRRIEFKVKFARYAWIILYDSATATELGNGMCDTPVYDDDRWHWVRCDYCTADLITIGRIDIMLQQSMVSPQTQAYVKRLRIWTCQ